MISEKQNIFQTDTIVLIVDELANLMKEHSKKVVNNLVIVA
ncbi:MAG TPA: hypothetical protein PKX91_03545 [Clostridia bacterium]|nr:hypothetical protein [Clostridia bacterium]